MKRTAFKTIVAAVKKIISASVLHILSGGSNIRSPKKEIAAKKKQPKK